MNANGNKISLIAAMSEKERVIGFKGGIPWKIPADMERFKNVTMGHPVIMGRKTWESIPAKYRPLPGRSNIVITRDALYQAPSAQVVHSLQEAVTAGCEMEGGDDIFIIGGGAVYAEALPFANTLYLTLVQGEFEGDAFFPEFSGFKNVVSIPSVHNGLPYTFVTLER